MPSKAVKLSSVLLAFQLGKLHFLKSYTTEVEKKFRCNRLALLSVQLTQFLVSNSFLILYKQ